jgi:tRNA threonylcarbamoyladenosine biosynthesis protein TsaB
MIVLAIDASTYDGSVAVLRDQTVVAERVVAMRGEQEERLMPAVADVLTEAGVRIDDVDTVACGAGPGSFTSLRIAASIAKGIARARGIPLLVAPSLLLVAAGARPALPGGRYVAVLDAMRGDVFGTELTVSPSGGVTGSGDVWRATREEASGRAARSVATLIGPAEAMALAPHARGFAGVLAAGLARDVDVRDWEPEYGRKAEAQVRWEAAHGRPLDVR